MVTPVNSVINLSAPASAPDGFQNPEVRSAVELFLNISQNILDGIELYVAPTQKDVSTWNDLSPSDTLIRQFAGRLYVTASEAILNGDLINLHASGGLLRVRKANATSGTVRRAMGYCTTTGGIANGARGEVILSQGLLTISGVVPGDLLFLSTTAGLATLTAPTGAGQLEQYIGVGVDTNLAYIDIATGQYIQH